jgi:DNA repair protein RecO (recombination protein O)
VVRFELALLGELGFGLDLAACALTGRTQDLAYVSPRSGRAVCSDAAGDWRDRLLRLPGFLRPGHSMTDLPAPADVADGFRLTGYFLERHVFQPRGIAAPQTREAFVAAVTATVTAAGDARD